MALVEFLSDYRGELTKEQYYEAGAAATIDDQAARTLARRGIVKLVPVLKPVPEPIKPAPKKTAPKKPATRRRRAKAS